MRHSGERSQFDEWLADIDVSRVMWIILFVILGLIIAWGIFTSYYTVQPEGQAVVKRFGKVIAIKDPGLHFKLPFGIDEQEFVPTARVLKQEFGFRTAAQEGTSAVYRKSEEHRDESLMLTGDLKVVDVEWVVQYRVDDPDKYLHRVEQVDKTIRDISEAVMRRIVGNNLGSDVLTIKRVEIALNAKEEIQHLLDSFDMGVRIGTVELQDVNPPDSVKPAFNEVNQAEQEKEQLINEAEKKQNQQIPAARGKAKQVVATAEGYRAERVNGALGETSRFKAILKEYKVAPEVTRRRMYLETLDKVLPSLGKIYIIEPGGQSPIPLLNLDKNNPVQNR
ncbi:FtsH protease activity modulator HflK [Gimesia benthica]|uniref:Protein HflK n=1 Tax=Gimesia benthica TaxID=2608982 RepID=A0A6I6A8X7_9PLAN|nr:FtsH protease activity modulator HflK [Gimesia benthica]QGQ22022.1 FtsH protease activity modulator HflK [Gimesia benthica]